MQLLRGFASIIVAVVEAIANFWRPLSKNAKIALGGSWFFFACIICSSLGQGQSEISVSPSDSQLETESVTAVDSAGSSADQIGTNISLLTPIISSTAIRPTSEAPIGHVNACVPNADFEVGIVSSVVDGDTIRVDIEGHNYSVRYIGIDTPDNPIPDSSSLMNANLVGGKTITLYTDQSETDQFGRLLRFVYVGDTFVNYELVRLGFASAFRYPPDISCSNVFAEAETNARSDQLGIWEATPTALIGSVSSNMTIVGVNKEAEYVDIRNTGNSTQDLGGWYLVSERGNQTCYLFGAIGSGETLRLWAMDSNKGGFYCGFNTNIWNNRESDPAVLYDNNGSQVDRYP